MSQNGPYSGPPWSNGNSEEPYREPSDPWGGHGAVMPESPAAWGGHPPSIPQQVAGYHSAPMNPPGGGMWHPAAPPPPPRRNTPMIVLVVTLAVLVCLGLAATGWLLKQRNEKRATPAPTTAAASAAPVPLGSEDARFFVKKGDCVVNEGSDEKPAMRTTPCTTGTYDVLDRITGKTTGKKDAESKCAKVKGYTKWYFYDSPLDDLDFVLCLREHKRL